MSSKKTESYNDYEGFMAARHLYYGHISLLYLHVRR